MSHGCCVPVPFVRAVDAVHKLGETNRREHCPLIAGGNDDLLEHLHYVIASAFSGDDYAGVQD
jgi:hypothetical protein